MELFFIYFILINIIGLYVMHFDKQMAIQGKKRVPEKILWRLAILGGGIGVTIGMKWFRHKTKHTSFVIGLPAVAIIQVLFVLYILTKVIGRKGS